MPFLPGWFVGCVLGSFELIDLCLIWGMIELCSVYSLDRGGITSCLLRGFWFCGLST